MTTIYDKGSFSLECTFYDEDGDLVVPESLTYTIINASTDVVVRTATVTPSTSSYTIDTTVTDNTLVGKDEQRKIVVHWVYSGGTKGDSIVEDYRIREAI
jgi:hypothetical protein